MKITYHSTSGGSSVRIWRATWIGFGALIGASFMAGAATAARLRRTV